MNITVHKTKWCVIIPPNIFPGYKGIVTFICLNNNDLNFSSIWEQPTKERERFIVRAMIANRLKEA